MRSENRTKGLAALIATAISAIAITLSPAAARADGGQSIAGATPVAYGQQEFGNTGTGGVGESRCSSSGNAYRSWWGFSVTSGDELKVDWETHEKSMVFLMFQVGTTDFTFLTSSPLIEQQVNTNYKEEAKYTATQTGILPAEFKSDTGCGRPTAPYNFTATVLHAVVLSLPTLTTLSTSGTITVAAHNPDGVPINDASLLVSFDVQPSGSTATSVGTAPVINGAATIPFTIPAAYSGQSVTVQAISVGAAYIPGSSATQIVSIAKPVRSPTCVVPHVRHNEVLARVESAIRHAHCAVGTIRHVRSRHHRPGTVVAVSPRPGSHLAALTPIRITVSRGRHQLVH